MDQSTYIHGTSLSEQKRLELLNRLTNPTFIRFLELHPEETILELGSGTGILASEVALNLSSGSITGVEQSPEQLAQCPPEHTQLSFVEADVNQLPFASGSFDKVYGRFILEHVSNPEKVIGEARRVLKPGGRIYFQENAVLLLEFYPYCPKFRALWQKFVELQSRLGGDAMIGIKLYSLLKQAGFTSIDLSVAPQTHHYDEEAFHMWIDNIIGNAESAREALIRNKLVTESDYREAIEELNALKSNEYASSFFCWNRASGIKPE